MRARRKARPSRGDLERRPQKAFPCANIFFTLLPLNRQGAVNLGGMDKSAEGGEGGFDHSTIPQFMQFALTVG
jgi:hypothetical protein